MAKKNSAVLWTVGQSLEKGDKEQARHNMGISFESSTTLDANTLTFVDDIKENATTGDLTFTKKSVTVDSTVTSTGKNPVSGEAVSTAISNIEFMKTGTTDPSTTPTKLGIHYRNTVTGEVWIATGTSSASDWKLLSDRIHVLMNQNKIIRISGEGSNTPILCDKFNYTIDSNNRPVFTPVSPEQAYIWVNRGDFIVFDSCAENDPWGDSYWMQQVEVQSDTALKEVTNFGFTRVTAGQIFHTWFNPITDSSTNTKYFTNNGTIDEKKIGDGHLQFKFGNPYDVFDTGFNANSENTVTYEMPLAGNKYGVTKLLKYPSPAPSDWNTFYDTNDAAVTPTYISHYVESNFFRKREVSNPKWNSILHQDSPSEAAFWFITNSATPDASNESPESGALYLISGGATKTNTTGYRTQLAMGNHLYYRHTTGNGNSSWSDWITLNEYSAGTDLKLTGTTFSVDTTSTIDNHSNRSFVLGPNNTITYSDDSFTGGTLNKIAGMNSSFAFGTRNIIGAETASENIGTGNTAFGQSNTIVQGRFNIIFGSANTITKGNSPSQGNDPYNNIIIGENNRISGNSSAVYSHDTILIGNSLTWSEPNYHPLVLGVFNTDSWRYKNENLIPLRITGGGTIDSPKNVEVMYSDGLIWSNSGFEVSDDTDNGHSTYRTHIYKTLDSSFKVNGTGVYSKWTHTDVISSSRILDYAETGHLANTFISVSSAKTDSNAKTAENPTGLVNITSVANQILKRIPSGQHDPSDKTCVPIIEFSSTTAGGNVGLTMGNPALPAWNTKEARSTDKIALSWLQVYGNRNAKGDEGGDILPSANSVPLGNLEVGKIAVKFYKETELTAENPLVPGQKVGDISFVVGDPNTTDHGFYVYDYYQGPNDSSATPQSHKTSYINNGYNFCMLMTVTPSSFDPTTHMMTTPGSFCVLS